MRRFISLVLVFSFLSGIGYAMAASAGTASDPLVTESYVEGTYRSSLISQGESNISTGLGEVYNSALSSLTTLASNYISSISGAPDSGYTFADDYVLKNFYSGGGVTVTTGSSVILISGSAYVTVTEGTVVNVSTGEEIASGSSLTRYQRYFAAEDTVAVFTMDSSGSLMTEGWYSITDEASGIFDVFSDISINDWYCQAVSYVYDAGLFNGTSSTTFSPGSSMTRAMFVTVLYRLDGSPDVSGSSEFTDLDTSMYYMDAVIWASSNGIISGYGNGKFGPDDSVTREQMAVIMYNYALYSGESADFSDTAVTSFPDCSSVSDWAYDAVSWATYNGIINGSDGYLLPAGTATRAQVAQIIMNYSENIG